MIVDICLWRLVFSGNQGAKHPPEPPPSEASQVGSVCLFILSNFCYFGLIKLCCCDYYLFIFFIFTWSDPKDFILTRHLLLVHPKPLRFICSQEVNDRWGSSLLSHVFCRRNKPPKALYRSLAVKVLDEADWPPSPSSITYAANESLASNRTDKQSNAGSWRGDGLNVLWTDAGLSESPKLLQTLCGAPVFWLASAEGTRRLDYKPPALLCNKRNAALVNNAILLKTERFLNLNFSRWFYSLRPSLLSTIPEKKYIHISITIWVSKRYY